MGVHSFWEGVDVKGERLSCVIIDKLPFSVPDTPINRARCEQIEQEGGNWFTEYAIPQAQIRLKQGFGRLIRTKTDVGVVAILDVRIHRKYYGKEFVRYLPQCRGTKDIERVQEFLGTFDKTNTISNRCDRK
jgi:ATP-dependent DNA helicase DinG